MANNADGLIAALVLLSCWRFPRIAAVLCVLRLGLFGLMWTVDWSLADGRVLIETPLIAVTLALLRWERRLAVIPAVVCLYAAYVSRPAPPYLDDAVAHWIPVALLPLLLLLRKRTRIAVVAVAVPALVAASAWASVLPDRVGHDLGHGGHGGHGAVSIAQLTGPRDRAPDRSFTLTATAAPITLGSGRVVPDGLVFNGQAPGPELRVVQGELVEVTLVNQLPDGMGVTIHWHGVNVPNAEDGVAGVTQDAVPPGGQHVYRLVAEQAGTFWYHTHQEPLWAMRRGLFGALVVTPREPSSPYAPASSTSLAPAPAVPALAPVVPAPAPVASALSAALLAPVPAASAPSSVAPASSPSPAPAPDGPVPAPVASAPSSPSPTRSSVDPVSASALLAPSSVASTPSAFLVRSSVGQVPSSAYHGPAPVASAPSPVDLVVMAHEWRVGGDVVPSFGTDDGKGERLITAGSRVRIRLVNTDNNPADDASPRGFALLGVAFRVVAIDGVDVSGPGELRDVALRLAAGGRYDLEFTMPERPVLLADLGSPDVGLVLTPGSGAAPGVPGNLGEFDPAHYGAARPVPYARFDREFVQLIDDRVGFYDGSFHLLPTINGHSFPDVAPLVVRLGETVKVRIINRSHQNHPMHLHGHTMLVLSRAGRATSGSPWWTDSLDVRPGEIFEVAFRADNPGVWMDHCHNLDHAANGMVMHLLYDGYTSPYESGRATPNHPE